MFALSGLHRVLRGAEVAFQSIAQEIATAPGWEVTVFGSGTPEPGRAYEFRQSRCVRRERFERWPKNLPLLRNECAYEELSFALGLLPKYSPKDFDVTVTCTFPYVNWALRARDSRRHRPAHVFVTQNGDWPAFDDRREFKWFSCDGLVCTNPEYHERNKDRWRTALIPNGVDPDVFEPGPRDRARFGLPATAPVALVVSALIPSKRVVEGIRCASQVDDLHLVVAGDGPLRDEVDRTGQDMMGERFRRITVPREAMPDLYRCADAFLHMSQDEPSANAYIEALATGLPIVTHDRLVTAWTFDGTALLVDTSDTDAVVNALGRAIDASRPEQVSARRELVHRRFSWSGIARSYREFFGDILADADFRADG